MRNWDELYEKIGPLRYQASDSDCVPTTIVNGLMVLLEKRLHPKLLQLVWALAGDQDGKGGTGWVCCDTLAALLKAWFERAHQDDREESPLPFTSQIIEKKKVNLSNSGELLKCLRNGGVACLTTGKRANHYTLLIGLDNGLFVGFDSWWQAPKPDKSEDLANYNGLVNITWTRQELKAELEQCEWAHLLGRK